MAEKKSIQTPIDMPLSKAYLREFSGWSTAYPPGLSDPTSLRIMENIQITREGGARVRPALRSVLTEDVWLDNNHGVTMVGGFVHFFLNDGSKALLFAVRETDEKVSFRVGVYNEDTHRFDINRLTDAYIDFTIPQGEAALNFSTATTYVQYLQIDNKIFALSDAGEALRMFFVGANKRARLVTAISVPAWSSGDALTVRHPTAAWINGADHSQNPAAQTPTAETLISSDATKNKYNFGYFYTFENEVGESAPSQLTIVQAQRGWSQWKFFKPDGSGNPTTTPVTDPGFAMDQFTAFMPTGVYASAKAQGAIKWSLYMFTWSDQEAVPPEGVLVGTRAITAGGTHSTEGWIQNTAAIDVSSSSLPLPTIHNRYNFSDPAQARQGLVAGDRLVLVNDRRDGAIIRWSSNQAGEYTNFSPSRGGGTKTLTSGNLNIPVCVKLWQNPQSVDTITILCSGVDGYSTAYYMAPASVDGQSGSTSIMGFEETTATPGTTSPYGVEVFNNALYHPIDTELMKSTAANYSINHSPMTNDIANKWKSIRDKNWIVSSQLDGRLYYLVNNPDGEEVARGCNGNEIWVFDGAKDAGSWSRWLVQGISLSKLEIDGQLYMSVSRPEGIFVFDDAKMTDDVSSPDGTMQQGIPWQLETNTQGANRAHDAWARVQQVNVDFGNWRGILEYGIRGRDVNGKDREVSAIYRQPIIDDFAQRPLPFDTSTFMRVSRDFMEWHFFARSVTEANTGMITPSYGQINLIQYRIAPISVNIGYEYGSVETFEYGRASQGWPTNTDNGTPNNAVISRN